MREYAKFLLSQHPTIYDRILRLKHRKEYDNERIVFLNAIHRGDTVFDIGANRGIHTVLLSHLAGAKGAVHAFEPVPPTFARLSQTVAQKKRFDNVTLVNSAVSDAVGTITINMPDGDDGQASIAKHDAGSWKNAAKISTFECAVTTLDAYTPTIPKPPDFIKCDVEGAELLTLRGGRKVLSQHAPILFLEVCPAWARNFGYAPIDILNFVKPYGYDTFFVIDDHGVRRAVDPAAVLSGLSGSGSIDLLCSVSKLHRDRLINLR